MIAWSIVAASQAALSGKASFFACRVLIGALEGGFIADLVLWQVPIQHGVSANSH
jgi:hypothetical protein